MPKYVIFTPTWGKTVGGTAKVARGLLYAIKELAPDSEFFVFSSDMSGEPDNDVVCVDGKICGSRTLYYLSSLRRIRPDLIHCQGRIHQLLIGYVYKRLFNPSVRLICSFYTQPTFKAFLPGDIIPPVPKASLLSAVKKMISVFLLNRADSVVANSRSLADNTKLQFAPGLNREISVIPSGVEEPLCAGEEVKAFVEKYNLGQAYPVFLSVGVFSWDWKVAGLLLLLDSFSAVIKECHSARLVIVGDGRYASLINAKIAELALEEHVILTGNLKNTFVPLAASHVYCHLALNESSSVSIIEAMVCGKPILVSRAGGNAELIISGRNGLVVEPDIVSASTAMIRLAKDTALAGSFGAVAKSDAAEKYRWPAIAREYLKLYLRAD